MKRTRHISLALLTSLSLGLAGCGDPPQNHSGNDVTISENPDEIGPIFKDTQACIDASYSREQCDDYKLVAEQEFQKTAPKYSARDVCEKEHGGACQQVVRADGGSSFMPFMLGYMVGNMTSGNRAPMPVYRTQTDDDRRRGGAGSVYTSNGAFVGRSSASGGSVIATPNSSIKPGSFSAPRAASFGGGSVARGGFGASAGGHAGGGGGS